MEKGFSQTLKIRLGKYWSYLLLILALLFVISLVRNIIKIVEAGKRIDEAKARVEKLKDENSQLKSKLSQVQSETFIEKQLRDRLGLAKEEEIIVVLPDEETLRQIAPKVAEEEENLPDPIWKKWLKLFL